MVALEFCSYPFLAVYCICLIFAYLSFSYEVLFFWSNFVSFIIFLNLIPQNIERQAHTIDFEEAPLQARLLCHGHLYGFFL